MAPAGPAAGQSAVTAATSGGFDDANGGGGSVPAAAAGFVGGAVGGALIGVSVATVRAGLFDSYFYGKQEALTVLAGSALAGGLGGLLLGAVDSETLGTAAARSLGLGYAGFWAGLIAGQVFDQDRHMAPAMIGLGAGLLAGTVWALVETDNDSGGGQSGGNVTIPLGLRIRF